MSEQLKMLSKLLSRKSAFFRRRQPKPHAYATTGDTLQLLIRLGATTAGSPVRLHLGCGETKLPGYVNIDFPQEEHNLYQVLPDYTANLTALSFTDGSVDEIRLHHVFEHLNRVVALGMLIRWHRWLRLGGLLTIETPDFCATAAAALRDSGAGRAALVRHLEGDQSAAWGYHVGQWYPERFERTLTTLGYDDLTIETTSTDAWHTPPLHNVTARAVKRQALSQEDLIVRAEELLWESTVAAAEKPTWTVWCAQLRKFLDQNAAPKGPSAHIAVPKQVPVNPLAVESSPPPVSDDSAPIPSHLSLEKQAFNARKADMNDLPELIFVEPAMACNLGCEMCPVPHYSTEMGGRNRSIMKPEVYRKVLDALRGKKRVVWLNQLGEPLINKHIVDFVKWAKRDGHVVAFTTNGTLMTEDIGIRLLDAGIDKVVFSFDGGTRPTFERIRIGADFEVTVTNIRTFGKMARDRAPPCAVEVHMIVSDATEQEMNSFRSLFEDVAHPHFIPLDDWAGQLELPTYFGQPRTPKDHVDRYPCDLLWTTAYVSAEGRAMYCCHDYKHTSSLTRITDKSLDDIWRNEIFEERKRHASGIFDRRPCANCSAWKTRPSHY